MNRNNLFKWFNIQDYDLQSIFFFKFSGFKCATLYSVYTPIAFYLGKFYFHIFGSKILAGSAKVCFSPALLWWIDKIQFSSIQSLSCIRLCNPMNRSTPGLPVHHQPPEFTQTHVHWVGDWLVVNCICMVLCQMAENKFKLLGSASLLFIIFMLWKLFLNV